MALNDLIGNLNGVLFSDYTVYALLLTGLVFTIWSFFGQYRALTHGVSIVRGKYDDHDDPGAINHFQALSAALSATVGLGNIAGVAIAVALGGPGAILWMWVIGLLGMSLKMTEVTQSMLYRNTQDPENPHGGPMFVVSKGLREPGPLRIIAGAVFAAVTLGMTLIAQDSFGTFLVWIPGGALAAVFLILGLVSGRALGAFFGGIFVVTTIISAITGGNMFQAWNVADITFTYFQVPQVVTGIILTILVGLVIIGGIKRIGAVAGRIVPLMCGIYVLAALVVLLANIGDVPAMLALIVKSGLPTWLGGASADASGAFLGGTFAYAAMWGIKRALFSSEAGQGSSPIAHSAAKTDEPVREGVVAGLEPFIDTIVVCTLTALVILSTGAYNRGAEADFAGIDDVAINMTNEMVAVLDVVPEAVAADEAWAIPTIVAPPIAAEAAVPDNEASPTPIQGWKSGESVFVYADVQPDNRRLAVRGTVQDENGAFTIEFVPVTANSGREPIEGLSLEDEIYRGATPTWTLETSPLPRMSSESRKIRQTRENESGWREGEIVFFVVAADASQETGRDMRKITGTVNRNENDDWIVSWNTLGSEMVPRFREHADGSIDLGVYGEYAGASMTAYAFDRQFPGLGKWLVSIAAWLFAVSTMISWSYYGEQGIYYFFGTHGEKGAKPAVFIYKIIYSLLILVTTLLAMPLFGSGKTPIIATEHELDMWTTLGMGVMLVANIPIMWLFAHKAMGAYHEYFDRMKHGGDDAHEAPPISDVVEGKDVE